MKILWLSHLIPYPPKGGVLQRSYNLVRELSRYHEIDLLAFNQKRLIGPLFASLDEGVNEAMEVLSHFCGKLCFFDIASGNTLWGPYLLALKSLFLEPYNINWLKSKAFADKMIDYIEEEKYDLIHFDTISLIPFFPLVPSGTSTSLDHHNIESHMLLRRARHEKNIFKRSYYWQEGIRLARYERYFCPKFSLNITCSDIDRERLLKIAPHTNARTIPNGVDLEFFNPKGVPSQSRRLIFVGTMNWYPNIEAVLYIAEKIWPELKLKYPELEFDIIGANPPLSILEIADRCPGFHVHGFVNDVRPYIERATVYVCPIRDGGGTKLKILDAMAMFKAVVAHPVACEGINVQNGHNILLADNKPEFIEQIRTLLDSKQKRDSLGRQARKTIEDFYGYHSIGMQLSNAFQKVVN